jgi:8-oxo-dGTP pyrophosphatase MutT (NUDIX family)
MLTASLLTHAGGIVFRNSGQARQYLVITSSRGTEWVLPKGHIEKGETPEAAAVREVREEAGVVAEILHALGTSEYRKGSEQVRAQFYLMRAVGTAEMTEQRSIQWIRYREALELLSFPDMRRLLKRAEEWHSAASDSYRQ